MPSYRYIKDIDPNDLKPEGPQEYTRKEKISNWWRYHWKVLVVVLIIAALVVAFVVEMVRRTDPDLTLAIIVPGTLPDSLTAKLEEQLATLVGDLNGDGQVYVSVEVYTVYQYSDEEDASGGGAVEDAYAQMAGTTKLAGALSSGDVMIFIADPDSAQSYQDSFGLFAGEDTASLPEGTPVEEIGVAFGDLPALAGLDLEFELMDGTMVDGAVVLANYRIGIRPLADTSLENKQGSVDSWYEAKDFLDSLAA